jgi:acyl-CoA thioesterase-2
MLHQDVSRSGAASVEHRVTVRPDGDGAFVGTTPARMLRGSMFGGQILGQCMAAALATVPGESWPVSLQLYFIAAPDPDIDVVYRVSRRRDGGRYAWRHIVATQGEAVVLDAIAAFTHRAHRDVGSPHRPALPGPGALDAADVMVARHPRVIGNYLEHVTMGLLDVRYIQGPPPLRIEAGDLDPRQQFWVRPLGVRGFGPRVMPAVLAFLSDVNMLAMPFLAQRELGDGVRTYAASFDHSLRFYSPLDDLDWLIFHQESVVVAGTTVESRGRAETADGRLVFTVSQQGLMLPP